MKLSFKVGKEAQKLSFELEFLKSEQSYIIASQKAQQKPRAAQNGVQYHNCSFGQPFPIKYEVPIPRIQGTPEEAIRHAADQTGIEKEIIQRAVEAYRQYFSDKNAPREEQ